MEIFELLNYLGLVFIFVVLFLLGLLLHRMGDFLKADQNEKNENDHSKKT